MSKFLILAGFCGLGMSASDEPNPLGSVGSLATDTVAEATVAVPDAVSSASKALDVSDASTKTYNATSNEAFRKASTDGFETKKSSKSKEKHPDRYDIDPLKSGNMAGISIDPNFEKEVVQFMKESGELAHGRHFTGLPSSGTDLSGLWIVRFENGVSAAYDINHEGRCRVLLRLAANRMLTFDSQLKRSDADFHPGDQGWFEMENWNHAQSVREWMRREKLHDTNREWPDRIWVYHHFLVDGPSGSKTKLTRGSGRWVGVGIMR